jgi:hypothetical protein
MPCTVWTWPSGGRSRRRCWPKTKVRPSAVAPGRQSVCAPAGHRISASGAGARRSSCGRNVVCGRLLLCSVQVACLVGVFEWERRAVCCLSAEAAGCARHIGPGCWHHDCTVAHRISAWLAACRHHLIVVGVVIVIRLYNVFKEYRTSLNPVHHLTPFLPRQSCSETRCR